MFMHQHFKKTCKLSGGELPVSPRDKFRSLSMVAVAIHGCRVFITDMNVCGLVLMFCNDCLRLFNGKFSRQSVF